MNTVCTVQYSTLQYSAVRLQYSTVQYSTVQYSTVQYSTATVRLQYGTSKQITLVSCNNKHSRRAQSIGYTAQEAGGSRHSTSAACREGVLVATALDRQTETEEPGDLACIAGLVSRQDRQHEHGTRPALRAHHTIQTP